MLICLVMHVNQTANLLTFGHSYIGIRADINIWSPRVESPDEYTTAQIWLRSSPGNDFESIEAGWMVGSLNETLTLFLVHIKAHDISPFFLQNSLIFFLFF